MWCPEFFSSMPISFSWWSKHTCIFVLVGPIFIKIYFLLRKCAYKFLITLEVKVFFLGWAFGRVNLILLPILKNHRRLSVEWLFLDNLLENSNQCFVSVEWWLKNVSHVKGADYKIIILPSWGNKCFPVFLSSSSSCIPWHC